MNLAVTKLATLDVSGQYVAVVPKLEPEIQALRMIRASGALDLVLADVSKSSRILHHVNVSSCSLADLGVNSLCDVLSKPSLDCFEAAHMRSVSAAELYTLIQALNPSCRVLDLGGIFFQDDLRFDFAVFSKFDSLEKLSLAHWLGMTGIELAHLPKSITDLNLAGAEVGSFDFLRGMTGLGHLDLDGARLTSDAQQSLVDVLSATQNVRVRINVSNRLPNERAVLPEYLAKIPVENNILFY